MRPHISSIFNFKRQRDIPGKQIKVNSIQYTFLHKNAKTKHELCKNKMEPN